MRYFAEVDKDNKVINVIQAVDEEFIKTLGSSYIETFESETVIGARADKGYTYDASKKAFNLQGRRYSCSKISASKTFAWGKRNWKKV